MLSAYIRYAALNPYWYVPSDLAWEDVGQWVKKYGQGYFDRMGYEQVSDWSDNPQILDATKIDWDAVRDGTSKIFLRQKPGPDNFMGRMKFMFPNEFGVYLHDNPRRELFEKQVRYYSGGCVRLEDAARLGKWLFGHDLDWKSAGVRAAGDAREARPGLHHLPDGDAAGRWYDRLLQGRIRPRHGAAGDPVVEHRRNGRRPLGLAPPPVREIGDVLRDCAPLRVAGGSEAHEAHRQLANEAVDRRIAARPCDPAVCDASVRPERGLSLPRGRLVSRSPPSSRYSELGMLLTSRAGVKRE